MKIITTTLLISMGVFTGCGQAQVSFASRASAVKASDSNTTPSFSVPASGSNSGAATTSSGRLPVLKYQINGTGNATQYVSVPTRKTLKIRFIPGVQNKVEALTGATWHYSALSVTVHVGTQIQTLPFLRNGITGGDAESSVVVDFSNAFLSQCAATDSGCSQNITIAIETPRNDDACINYGWMYCPASQIPGQHAWNGTLQVQTDSTEEL